MDFRDFSLTTKFMIGAASILTIALAINLYISGSRINDQAEKAFADKLRQITGMAGETRAWAAAHQEVFRAADENGERDINSVPVVMAWSIAREYASQNQVEFKTPSPSPRNPKNYPDEFERAAMEEFSRNPALEEIFERQSMNGEDVARFIVPIRIEKDCLECHGGPKGELDPFGHPKEGYKVGDLRAAFSVMAPAHELAANQASNFQFGLISTLLVVGLLCVAIYVLIRKIITEPLGRVVSATNAMNDEFGEFEELVNSLAANDLSREIEETMRVELGIAARDEIGSLAKAVEGTLDAKAKIGGSLRTLSGSLRGIINQLRDNVSSLVTAATEVSSSAETLSHGSAEQTRQVTQVAAAVQQMAATVVESARNAEQAADGAKNAAVTAEEGGRTVADTISGMNQISTEVSNSAESIGALASSADEIGNIVSVIDDIADQTNLLALNAAIEAARAGEQGRGFAVVADEVRKLAEKTGKATGEIAQMIKGIQSDTASAVGSMESGINVISSGQELADKAGTNLNEIVSMSQQVLGMIQQIATASEEQSVAAEEISQAIETVNGIAGEASAGARESAAAAEELNRQAETIQGIVEKFRL